MFDIFTSKCAFRHRGVHFSNIRTSKSGPNTSCFVHFDFRMCFSPQRRAIFRHLNFKKWSETVCFLAFSLQKVLFATAACNFWCLLWAAPSAPAVLTGLLFDWPDTRIIEKTQHFATSLTFGADVSSFFGLSRWCIFLLLTWLPVSSAFSTLHIVGSLLFKLPSMRIKMTMMMRMTMMRMTMMMITIIIMIIIMIIMHACLQRKAVSQHLSAQINGVHNIHTFQFFWLNQPIRVPKQHWDWNLPATSTTRGNSFLFLPRHWPPWTCTSSRMIKDQVGKSAEEFSAKLQEGLSQRKVKDKTSYITTFALKH